MGICGNTLEKSRNKNQIISEQLIDNFIIAEIYIKEDEINKDIRIINSYEEHLREQLNKEELITEKMNEKEITECEIIINGESIPFSYFHKFKNKGYFTIKYLFNTNLTKTNHMFFNCHSLVNIYQSNFNTEYVTNMEYMFYGCSSVRSIHIANYKTGNVKNMSHMFCGCSSLKGLDLSNFDTKNVTTMTSMFEDCTSLVCLDLRNFNTEKVFDMVWMFHNCSSLEFLNIYNFNIQNVIDLSDIFQGCVSLKNKKNIIAKDRKRIFLQLLYF